MNKETQLKAARELSKKAATTKVPQRDRQIANWFDKNLSKHGKAALKRLQQLGFTKSALFIFLGTKDIEIGSRKITLRGFDSFAQAFDGTGMVHIRELRALVRNVEGLLGRIERLRKTPFVKQLRRKGVFDERDFLNALPVTMHVEDGRLEYPQYQPYFDGLLKLPALAQEHLLRRRQDFDRRLKAICWNVHDDTGQWNDDLIVQILVDLPITGPYPKNADALQKWRTRHDLRGR
jgi:hypothetical protein